MKIPLDDVRTVLGAKAIAIVRNLSDLRLQSLVRNLSSLVIFGGVAVGMFLLMRTFTLFLLQRVGVGVEPLNRLVALVLFAFFVSANFMSLLLSYATLFTAREVEFLQALPVPHGRLFMLRAAENVVNSTGVMLLLGTAGALGYGAAFHLVWYQYFLMMFAVMIPLIVIAGILGVAVLMFLIVLSGRIGVRWMLVLAIPLYFSVLAFSYGVTDPVSVIREAVASAHGGTRVVVSIAHPAALWFPHEMAASALRCIVGGDTIAAAGSIAGLFGMMLVLFAVVGVAGSRRYYTTWLLVRELRGHQEQHHVRAGGVLDLGHRWTDRPNAEAVLKRDILQFVRDPVQRIHALMMAVLVVLTVVFGKMSVLPQMKTVPHALALVTILLFDGFVVASIALRFVFPAVSLEGNAFWCVRTAPISLSRLYWMKFVLWVPIILVPAQALIWATFPVAHAPQPLIVAGAVMMLCAVIGLVSINLGVGAHYATQREENPVKVAASQGASVTFLVSLLYLMAVAAFLVIPAIRTFGGGSEQEVDGTLVIAVAAVAGISLSVAVFAHMLGIHALRKDF